MLVMGMATLKYTRSYIITSKLEATNKELGLKKLYKALL
jgi:hypothetical protein